MWKQVILVIIVVLMPLSVYATESAVGTAAAPFLTIGIGSRPQGMGGAYVAMCDDIHSLFWNPAGLARMNQNEVILIHSTWLVDTYMDYIGTAFVMGPAGTVGVSATMLNYGEMEVTTETWQEGTGLMFNSYDLAAAVSYGYRFYDRFSIGGNLKYITQRIWNESANGVAFDIGTLLITPLKDIRLGMSISNFGTKMKMSGRDLLVFHDPSEVKEGNNSQIPSEIKTDEWKLPLTMRLGIAGEVYQDETHRISMALDWIKPNDNFETLNYGSEYAFREYAVLRFGYRGIRPNLEGSKLIVGDGDNAAGWTFGGGIKLAMTQGMLVTVDYAYESFFRFNAVHKYSIGLKF